MSDLAAAEALQLGEPVVLARNIVISSFHELVNSLKDDKAPYIAYGVSYAPLVIAHISPEPVRVGIQILEYSTSLEEYTFINMAVGFFAINNHCMFEMRTHSRTFGLLTEDTKNEAMFMRAIYELRLRLWLVEPGNFVQEKTND